MRSKYKGKVLITRPQGERDELATHLHGLGYDTFCEPMMEIVYHPLAVEPPSNFAGLIFTSRHGVRALVRNISLEEEGWTSLPVYTVGDQTALVAKQVGFKEVYSAQGTVRDLLNVIPVNIFKPYLYSRGQEIASSLEDVPYQEIISYHTVMKEKFSDDFLQALTQGGITHATFLSLRTADQFVKLAQNHGVIEYFRLIQALCLGVSMLKSVSVLPWKDVRVAATPTVADMIALLGNEQTI